VPFNASSSFPMEFRKPSNCIDDNELDESKQYERGFGL